LITNTGRTILAKYLIGQAPAYASHIALGVGATPLDNSESFGDYSAANKGDLVIDVTNMETNERVDVEILRNGQALSDTIYTEES